MKGVWLQNWVGTHSYPEGVRLNWNWELNRIQYPDWDQIVEDWARDGVRPMVYMNPYFANLTGNPDITTNLFKDADSKGYFLKNSDGETYQIQSLSIKFGMVDFSNPDAKEWCKDLIKNNMLKEAKAVGWMADFAEYNPLDVVCANCDDDAITYHNRYPYECAKANQEAIAELELSDDIVYFMRAGSTHSPSVTSLYWMGD